MLFGLPVLVVVVVTYFTVASAQSYTTVRCPAYSASNTNGATVNFVDCLLPNVCPGQSLLIADCGSDCVGNQAILLYDAANKNSLSFTHGYCDSPFSSCVSATYTYTGASCTALNVRQGCVGNGSCSGKFKVILTSTSSPTELPTSNPTESPTFTPTVEPTTIPTAFTMVSADGFCPSYSTSDTNYGTVNTATCKIQLCPGTVLTAGNCGDSCGGDQYIRLYDSSNNLVMYNDDGCDSPYDACSQLTYVYRTGVCQTFSLKQGCFGYEACSGTMTIVKTVTAPPTTKPSSFPTVYPSALPSSFPTAAPSSFPTVRPSAQPTLNPSAAPSAVPTPAPTPGPITGFALTNINNFTPVTQTAWYRTKYVGVVYTINDCAYNYADDSQCQSTYPTANIVTLNQGGLPVKLAVIFEKRLPTTLPTPIPTSLPTTQTWTTFWSNISPFDLGETNTNTIFASKMIIQRVCTNCDSQHGTIYYKRVTAIPNGWSAYSNMVRVWASANNLLNVDFHLYSSWSDLVNDVNRWSFCNYDDFNNVGAFRDCGPDGYYPYQWSSITQGSTRAVTYSVLN